MELLSEDVEKMNQIYNYFIQLDQQGTLSELFDPQVLWANAEGWSKSTHCSVSLYLSIECPAKAAGSKRFTMGPEMR